VNYLLVRPFPSLEYLSLFKCLRASSKSWWNLAAGTPEVEGEEVAAVMPNISSLSSSGSKAAAAMAPNLSSRPAQGEAKEMAEVVATQVSRNKSTRTKRTSWPGSKSSSSRVPACIREKKCLYFNNQQRKSLSEDTPNFEQMWGINTQEAFQGLLPATPAFFEIGHSF